jgi:hypothetical protein
MRVTTFAWLALTLVACRDSNSGGDDSNPPDAAPPIDAAPLASKIQDVQSDAVPKGTPVALKGVIVTAIDSYGAFTGDVFIQDPAGGALSGVKIFRAPLTQVSLLAPGDVIDVAGAVKDEFALNGDQSGRTATQLKEAQVGSMTLTKTGTAAIPAPASVDAVQLAAMTPAMRSAEWERWEGVLVTVRNARQVGPTTSFGAGNDDQKQFRVSADLRVQSSLAALFPGNAFGTCFDQVTGFIDYAFNYIVLPRAAGDFTASGTACRPLATTIAAAQGTAGAEAVTLTNVVVTGRDDLGSSKGYWIADALAAAAGQGVYVFTGSALGASLEIGATVSLQGLIEEFDPSPPGDTLTEVIPVGTPTVTPPGGQAPTPLVVDAAMLSDIGPVGEPYEGVLVRTSTVKVTQVLANGRYELTANGGAKLILDDESYAPTPALTVGTCYASVTGLMHVQLTDNTRTINARGAADLVTGSGCL